MQVKLQTGEIKDVQILEVTPENYIVPEGEEMYYHCRIEVVKFSEETGARLSRPRMQCFGKKFFENGGLSELRRQGYKVDVLHDPNEWIAANAVKEAENARKRAEAQARKAKEQKEAEKAAMKAEIIAELKAAGVITGEPKSKKESKKSKTTDTEF